MGQTPDANIIAGDYQEELYQRYLTHPESVSKDWRTYFSSLDAAEPKTKIAHTSVTNQDCADIRLMELIEGYRTFGHLFANFNPLSHEALELPEELDFRHYGFSDADLDKLYPSHGLLTAKEASLKQIIESLQEIYCGTIGVEFKGLQNKALEKWIEEHVETHRFKCSFEAPLKQMILEELNRSEIFESFLHMKYVGQKRFSLEGAETLIPMLESMIDQGASEGVKEIYLGMAHRGRLNVLTNILNKSYAEIFSEFSEDYLPDSFEGTGDVKYHKGFLSETKTFNGHPVRIHLTPNPSHLESVAPVVEGEVKARQILQNDSSQNHILPILIHGDGALSGQGVVYETLQLVRIEGYSTGGTLHFVVNNQVAFTTSPKEGRSTPYCTSIARAFGAPVFHVNGEDPEGCVYATLLALQIRQKFHVDVFLDLNCYRKYGHNEGDEPAFTQPIDTALIKKKRPIRELYRDHLIKTGALDPKTAESLEADFKKSLQEVHLQVAGVPKTGLQPKNGESQEPFRNAMTGVDEKTLKEIAVALTEVPETFDINQKLASLQKERRQMIEGGEGAKKIDWGMAELMAYGSLLWQGADIRISGQDVGRGTFSHRHALWTDQKTEKAYSPLQHLKKGQGRFDIYNSPLSEFAALGFEFGYSVAHPNALVIWEAQFGDFANGAQVIIDQYIAPGEQKWGQKCNLAIFLPHGYEGQGPEHSSGRMERFLSLAGHGNMRIAYPSTPAQMFHLLRLQVLGKNMKPLIVFTPKALLRHPDCTSAPQELSNGSFLEAIDDPNAPKAAKRLVFCTGKVYYDILEIRKSDPKADFAVVRIEQLYPLPIERLKELIAKYSGIEEYIWMQEEPKNMGAWCYISHLLLKLLPDGKKLEYIGRKTSASPAVGSYALHKQELKELREALTKSSPPSIFEVASKGKS